MKHKDTLLITAFFPYLKETEFGGRSWYLAEQKYLPSLKSISKTETEMLIWTQEERFQESFDKLKDFVPGTTYVQELSLWDSPRYHQIKELKFKKEIDSKGNERSYDFCINKLWMIRDAIVEMHDLDYYFFIDAGLSYHNNIPDQYIPLTDQEGNISRFAECTLFNPKMIDGLKEIADQDKIFCIMMSRPEHAIDYEELPEYYKLQKTIIGGLFGGNKKTMLKFIDGLLPFVEDHLNKGHLYLEEVYLSLYYIEHPELFHVEEFDLWWHPGFACNFARQEDGSVLPGRKFYTILEKLNGIENNDENDTKLLQI